MIKGVFRNVINIASLTVVAFIVIGCSQYSVVTTEEINKSTEVTYKEKTQIESVAEMIKNDVTSESDSDIMVSDVVVEDAKELPVQNTGLNSEAADTVWESISYNNILIKDMPKKGAYQDSDMGLYWRRDDIQEVFYPDVQEVCETAFGDYISPLQGAFEMFYKDARHESRRLRTDKETVIIEQHRILFYLFLSDGVAFVSIEDRGDTYYTIAKILDVIAEEKIEVLEIPPTEGVGIAGTDHVPEVKNYSIHEVVTNISQIEYSKADIQLVFGSDVQWLSDKVFGDYVHPLQGLFILLEQQGYGFNEGIEEDHLDVMNGGKFQTTILGDDFLEFTLVLGISNRARVVITKNGDQYTTTFRLLKDGEFETAVQAG